MTRVTSVRLLPALLLIGAMSQTAAFAQAPATPAPAAPQAPAAPAVLQALTYEMAVQVIDAAEAEARKNKWNVTIVVTDAAGIPVALRRLTGASPRSYDIATRKAATVVASKLTTADYGAQLKAKTVTEVPNGITFAGGVPIMRGSEFIGAVGTSGVQAIQDEQISKAGASVIK
ncbi:MAG: heme-binding protein [Acidobacteria bacterium]|nr:heme-binding protein [Acidobacteriota bacterium]MSO81809.1 heme-binding protein [Acidobacteriota bacterium]